MTGYQSKRAMAQAKTIDEVNWADHEPDGLAQPEQEPVACKHEWFRTGAMEPRECRCIKCGAWNSTPPQRTWVYLTDEHIKEIVGPYGDTPIKGYTRKLVDQIEAKSKELNA